MLLADDDMMLDVMTPNGPSEILHGGRGFPEGSDLSQVFSGDGVVGIGILCGGRNPKHELNVENGGPCEGIGREKYQSAFCPDADALQTE
jgi:hypothetical protein